MTNPPATKRVQHAKITVEVKKIIVLYHQKHITAEQALSLISDVHGAHS